MNQPTEEISYRITGMDGDYKVEVNRPGEMIHVADGFKSRAEAEAWIAEDKRIAGIDARQTPIEPPHLREV
jgi:hypothetical protein